MLPIIFTFVNAILGIYKRTFFLLFIEKKYLSGRIWYNEKITLEL
ncbi:hypothetical protein HSIEG1_81 [Enterococcus sp. HSIEG1]|nr:hypothetical protein HSIEG1_81 [Enterococcus sp. HSIEG1]